MIDFNGEINGDCKRFLLKKQIKIQVKVSLIVAILFAVPIILTSVFWKTIALLMFLPFAFAIVFSALPPSRGSQRIFVPQRVYIDTEEQTIVHKCAKLERFHMLSSVKAVIDYGEWYYFIFEFEDRDPYFVCQKSLLTEGTLEEFEALFEGKIERQKK
ncbi:MAG: hypothetical protein IJW48_00050 [Clostridia bacterium]|nr:hypothetical protein [Clostridia bacterium]